MTTERQTTAECPRCKELEKQLAELKAEVASLKKDSSTSSKPPSSDIVKKKRKTAGKRGRPKKRKRGGQPGHPRHERKRFDPSELDYIHEYFWTRCPCCDGQVKICKDQARILQQVDLVERPIEITEHRSLACWCPNCETMHYCEIPEDIRKAGLTGPRLTALVAFMKSACHCSFSNIRKFLRDIVGVTISRGHLRNLCAKVSESLKASYEELCEMLVKQAALNVDETGHKENGQRFWTWCFRAAMFTVYRIDPSRGSQVLMEMLGAEFQGVLGCDYFSAYRKYMKLNENVLVQFCLAHLIRDVKYLASHPDPQNRDYGQRLTKLFRNLFGIIHRRDEYRTEAGFRRALEDAKGKMVWEATLEAPDTQEAANLAERFFQHTDAYFCFITTPDIEPTNNLAEQAIRFVAIHRRITQGTRGESGRRWCERIWTAITTCEQQSKSVFHFIHETVEAFFAGKPTPSLVPDT
jgi:transposase